MSYPIINNMAFSKPEQSPHSAKKVVKRKFPGPAGLLPDEKLAIELEQSSFKRPRDNHSSENDEVIVCSQRSASVFQEGPWVEMLKDFKSLMSGDVSLLDRYNIKWIKTSAFFRKMMSQKVPFLAAIIQSVDANNSLTSINLTLKDMTGEIEAAIISSLYQEYADDLTTGSVIVLKQFGVFTTGNNRFYLTITQNNLISIYTRNVSNDSANLNIRNYINQEEQNTSNDTVSDGDKTWQECSDRAVKKITLQQVNSEDILNQASKNLSDKESNLNVFCNKSIEQPNSQYVGIIANSNNHHVIINDSKQVLQSNKPLTSTTKDNIGLNVMPTSNIINSSNVSSQIVTMSPGCRSVATNIKNSSNITKIHRFPVSSHNVADNIKDKNVNSQISSYAVSSQNVGANTKKLDNIFDTDVDELSLCFEDDFEPDGTTKNEAVSVSKHENYFNHTRDFNNKADISGEIVRNSCNIVAKLEGERDTKQCVIGSKLKDLLARSKFKRRVCDNSKMENVSNAQVVEENKPEEKKNVDNENLGCSSDNSSNMIISGSQLCVKTTNVEHNQIWRNVLDDLDTDSLFEDF